MENVRNPEKLLRQSMKIGSMEVSGRVFKSATSETRATKEMQCKSTSNLS